MAHPETTDLSSLARAGIAAVAAVAAVLSFSALRQLAIACDTWVWLAWLFPLSLDAAAAFGTLTWLRAHRDEVAQLAKRLTFATIGLSVLGNGTIRGLDAAHLAPPWWVAVLVGAIPPAVFGAVVHLAVTATAADQDVDQTVPAPDQADEPGPTPAERVRELYAAEPELSQRKLAERLGVSRRVVRDALPAKLTAVS